MRAARVLGRVAADGAGFLTGRVGRIEESVRSRHERELLVDHAGLNHRCQRDRVDLDAAHAGHLQGDAAVNRDRAAGKSGAGAARHHGDVVFRGHLDHSRDLSRRRRENHRMGERALDRGVALEDVQVVGGVDHGLPADDSA